MFDAGAVYSRLVLDRTDFTRNLAAARADAARGITVPVDFSVSQNSVMRAVVAARAIFRANPITVPIAFNISQSAVMRAVVAARALLRTNPITIPVQLSVSAAEMARVGAVMQAYFLAHPIVIPVIFGPRPGPVPGPGGGGGGGGGGGFGGGLLGMLGKKIPLFGGAFGTLPIIGVTHAWQLLLQAITETAGTLIPAAIAFGAFGAAAVPTVQSIMTHLQHLQTVSRATGQAIYPLSGAFSKIAASVRPQVYQLYGDALTILGRKSGVFASLAKAAGTAVDQLGTRMTLAITGGKGFGTVMHGAAADLAGWGNLVGNIGGIIGNFLKVLPGYAEKLLAVAGGVTHVAETITGSGIGQKVLGTGLAFHGAAIYAGLGVTAIAAATRGTLTLLGNWSERAGTALLATNRFGAAGVRAGSAMLGLGGRLAGLAALPWGWIALAAAGVGFLVYKLVTAQDATQKWLGSLQQTLDTVPAFRGLTAIMGAQLQVTQHLAAAHVQLNTAMKHVTETSAAAGKGFSLGTTNVSAAQAKFAELSGGMKQLADEATLFGYRFARLSVIFGGTTNALTLLRQAGVTTKQMLDPKQWAQILLQVNAAYDALRGMSNGSGQFAANMNALTIAGSDQVTAMTNLNSAWDATIGIISGGQGAFITFEQSLTAVNTAAKVTGASMRGLNTPSLALRGAWQTSFTSGSKLIDTLRSMSSLSPGGFPSVTRALKDTVAQMLPLGKNSAATRAEMIGLAQEINPAVTSFKALRTWLGNTKNPGRDLNKILAAMGVNIQDLNKDASTLSSVMQSQMIGTFSAAKLAANGTNTAISNLAGAVRKGGSAALIGRDQWKLYYDLINKDKYLPAAAAALVTTFSGSVFKGSQIVAQTQSRRATLIRDFENAGYSAKAAAKLVDGLRTSILNLPTPAILSIFVKGTGDWTVTGGTGPILPGGGGIHRLRNGAAAGALITAGTTSTADDVIVRASKGELIVPTHLVPSVAPVLAGKIPGFARGGYVGSLPGLAAYDRQSYSTTVLNLEKAVAAATAAAIRSAQHASAAASSVSGGSFGGGLGPASLSQIENWWMGAGGPGGGTARVAAAITGAESGFNTRIVQQGQPYATTGWGLWQITPGNSEPQAGINSQLLNGPANAVAAVAKYRGAGGFSPWTTFEDGAYLRFMGGGGPHIFDKGGYLPQGISLAMNNTGRPERVSAPDADANLGAKLDRVIKLLEMSVRASSELIAAVDENAGSTAAGVADAIGGGARRAGFRAEYSPR
jgi:hypothetical protein